MFWLVVFFVFFGLAAAAAGVADPYEVLQVSRRASPAEIKRAHRALVLKFHPDKQADEAAKDAAAVRFMAIQEAFAILSDDQKRRNFDAFGHPDGPFGNPSSSSGGFDQYHEYARWASRQQQQHRPIESATPTLSLDEWYGVLGNATDDVWLVHFYAEGVPASYAVANAWEATAHALQHVVRVARVHHNEHPQLAAEAGLEHVPALVAIVDQAPHPFVGDLHSRFAVSAWLTQIIPDVAVRLASHADRRAFDAAAGADRVRLFFFTDSPRLSLAMRWAAFHYRRDIAVAVLAKATCADYAPLAREFGVASVPTLVLQRGAGERVQHLSAVPATLRATLDKVRYQRVPLLRQHRFEPLCGAAAERVCIVAVHRGPEPAAELLAELAQQQRGNPSLPRGGAPLLVWLAAADESAFVRRLALPDGHSLVALRVGADRSAYVTSARGELGALLAALGTDAELLLRAEQLALGERRAAVTRVSALPSLASDATWPDWAQRRARDLYRWVAKTVGLSSIFTLLIITYSFWGVCCGRSKRDAANDMSRAEEALRATGMMPEGRDWLLEARLRVGRGERFDTFGQLEKLIGTLKPAHFDPAFPPPADATLALLQTIKARGFTFCVVLLEREPPLSPIAAEHYRFLVLKSLQCKAVYHAMFSVAQLSVHAHADVCRLLQALNESSRPRAAAGAAAPRASVAEWDTLPKLMAVNVVDGRATFFRGPSVRSSLCSDWLEQLVRNRLNEVAQWVDIADILHDA